MCGIVGYTGYRNGTDVVLNGLDKLQYRGYDSSGIAIITDNKLVIKKHKGRINVLKEELDNEPLYGNTAIGHTRWATHGAPSDENAHPHTSNDGIITLVHNGIIENYVSLRNKLQESGYNFVSETDTEVIVHLIRDYYHGDILDAVINACKELKGAYALVVVTSNEPGRIIATKNSSPLILGIGKDENFIASDIPAVLDYTKEICALDENIFCDITKNDISLYDNQKNPVKMNTFHVDWNAEDAEKGEFPHFMLKEIFEQPSAIANTLSGRLSGDSFDVNFSPFELDKEYLDYINTILIIACGTSYYAGCACKSILEAYSCKNVEIKIASEYRYDDVLTNERTFVIVISQSGETADTLESLRLAKSKGARVLAITNVLGSSISREANDVIYTWAGPEIAVASTKAYSTQIMCLYMLALKIGYMTNIDKEKLKELRDSCLEMPSLAKNALNDLYHIKKISKIFKDKNDAFYIGRGIDSAVALEGSLKMKEISYIHAEAYPAGELKHGPIALIDENTPVIALCTQNGLLSEKTYSNIKEVKARGAYAIVITQKSFFKLSDEVDEIIYIEDCNNNSTIIPTVIKLQLLAYYTACEKGCDVDKPRNLAKSVTVE